MRKRTFGWALLVALSTILSWSPMAQAQGWPEKPVRVIVPFGAGGGNDFVARVVMDYLSRELGQNFIIENMPGANAALGLQALKRSEPDGYTIAVSSDSTLAINPTLRDDLPYAPLQDFAPVTLLAETNLILVAHPSLNAKTLGDLIARAKAEPGKIRYGSCGIGNMSHLSTELLAAQTETTYQHIPYPGCGPASIALLSGDVHFAMLSQQAVTGQVRSGDLIGLGLNERQDTLPEVPSFAEGGLEDYRSSAWVSLLAPAGTPEEIIERLHDTASKALRDAETVERLANGGWHPLTSTPAEFEQLIEDDTAKWKKVIEEAGIVLE